MAIYDNFKKWLGSTEDIVEVQVEYLNGDKKDYGLDEGVREELIDGMIGEVNWDEVGEIELEYADGSKGAYKLESDEYTKEDEDEEEEEEEEEEGADEEEEDEEEM